MISKFNKIYKQIILQQQQQQSASQSSIMKIFNKYSDYITDKVPESNQDKCNQQLNNLSDKLMQKEDSLIKLAKENVKKIIKKYMQQKSEKAESSQKKEKTAATKKESAHDLSFNASYIADDMTDEQYKNRFIKILNQYKNSPDKEVKVVVLLILKLLKKNKLNNSQRDDLESRLTELTTLDAGKELAAKLTKLMNEITDEAGEANDAL